MGTQSKVLVIGNIGDVQVKPGTNGKPPYIRLSVAVDEHDSGSTFWWSVIISGRKAANIDNLMKVFTKGRLIHAFGQPKITAYLKADKTAAVSATILVDELPLLLDAKPNS